MLKLISFEIRKILRSSYSYIILGFLLLFLIGFFIYSHIQTTYVNDRVEQLEAVIDAQKSFVLKEFEQALVEDPSLKENSSFMRDYEGALNSIKNFEREAEAVKEADWTYLYDKELEFHEDAYNLVADPYNPYPNYTRWPSDFLTKYHYHETLWLKERNIEPILPIGIHSKKSIYDLVFDDSGLEETVEKYSNQYSTTSIFFTYKLFSIVLSIIGVAFFLFLFGDIVTKEELRAYGPINFLYTQPVSRGKIFISKFLTLFIVTFIIFIVVFLLSILLGGIFNGIGHWDYPVLVYQPERDFIIIPMISFIGKALLLFLGILMFAYSLLVLFSLITKRTVLALGFTLGVIILGVTFSGEPTSTISAFNPFQYFDVYDIISLETAAIHENFNLNWTNGMISLVAGSILLLLGTYSLSKVQ